MIYADNYEYDRNGGLTMTNANINNEIGLSYPEGYKEMTEQELTKYFGSPNNRWGIYNADKHVIISFGWTKGGFLSSLTDADSFLMGMVSRMRRSLVNYQQTAEFETRIANKKAKGVRFEYRVNDSIRIHTSDLIVFKNKKKFYAVQFVAHKATAEEYRTDFLEVLKSVSIAK